MDSRIALTSDMLPAPLWRDVTRIKPDAGECEANPRARSAVMRLERTYRGALGARRQGEALMRFNVGRLSEPFRFLVALVSVVVLWSGVPVRSFGHSTG